MFGISERLARTWRLCRPAEDGRNCRAAGFHDGTQPSRGLPARAALKAYLRPAAWFLIALGALAGMAAAGVAIGVHLAEPRLTAAAAQSVTVVDRDGRLLRAFTTPEGRWRLPASPDDVDGRYIDMLVAYEDRRFHEHIGVDPLALGRAMGQLLRHGRIVSGASTLTMQVARLLEGPEQRGMVTKVRQMFTALTLERRLTKTEILALYLRLAPFGGNIEGVRAASLAYLGKEPVRLSVADRALLVAIPQSPEARRPDRNAKAARQARDRVLARALDAGVITSEEAAEARRAPVAPGRRPFPRLAPHLAEAEVAREPSAIEHRLTIDRVRQQALEQLAGEHARRLGPHLSVALIAVEHRTGEIVAHVGSAGYLDTGRLGAIDMTTAVRSPGSTLKPFIYGLAFERGLAHPETMIEDRPARFGRYAPNNFDEDFRGTVSIREALAHSLNIPAVKVLADVGPLRLVGRMRRAGVSAQLPAGADPSLAVALGGVGLTLTDLARLYAAVARGGEAVSLRHAANVPGHGGASCPGERHGQRDVTTALPSAFRPLVPTPCPVARLLSARAAWHIGDILKDAPPPASARGQRIAFKTGTSYGYRDAWAVGFDGRHTVAVWAGRADGTATPGLTGHGSAAPLLFDAFGRLGERLHPLPSPPEGVTRIRGMDLPLALRRYREAGGASSGEPPVAIAFPPDRAELEPPREDADEIILKAEGGALPLTWVVDGIPLEASLDGREASWKPKGLGFARISVIDATGRADRVTVRLR
jgi:penicillin-binding protein 1C